jgi:hypothetical protein
VIEGTAVVVAVCVTETVVGTYDTTVEISTP